MKRQWASMRTERGARAMQFLLSASYHTYDYNYPHSLYVYICYNFTHTHTHTHTHTTCGLSAMPIGE